MLSSELAQWLRLPSSAGETRSKETVFVIRRCPHVKKYIPELLVSFASSVQVDCLRLDRSVQLSTETSRLRAARLEENPPR